MNIKKILKYNLILLVIIFLIIELLSYISLCYKYNESIKNYIYITTGKKVKIPYIPYKLAHNKSIEELINLFRPVENQYSKEQPIFLFGCSYTYGFGLEENQTFSKKLADYTNRPVYNRGLSGTGLPFLYYQLSNDKIAKSLPDNPKYIIYTLIPDHLPRLFRYRNWVMTGDHTLRYKITNDNKLVLDKSKFIPIHSLFTSIVIEEYIVEKKSANNKLKLDLTNKILEESHKKIKEYYKDSKFVILYYSCPLDIQEYSDAYYREIKEALSKTDIIFIDINKELPELYEQKYWIEDNSHPSAKAWDIIVPFISKKLKLKNN